MPYSSTKKAVSVREVDPEALPISTPRYFLTLHIVARAPAPQNRWWLLMFCSAGARATTHRVVLTSLAFRAQIEGVRMHPTVTQMMPQTRHYVDRCLIFDKFDDMFKDYNDFTKICDVNFWKSIGAEFFFLRNGLCLVPSSRRILTSLKMQCRSWGSLWALLIR